MTANHAAKDAGSTALSVNSTGAVSAVSKVFGTYELLESIISALPGEDILVAAYVHKDWKDVIASSPAIDKVIASTPFFVLEQDQNDSLRERSKDSPLLHSKTTHLILAGCDVVIHRVGAFEAIALLHPTPVGQGQKCLISFLARNERIPGLKKRDHEQLCRGWTRPSADRFQPRCNYNDLALLKDKSLSEDIAGTATHTESEIIVSAMDKVLNTYELLEMIILATHPSDTAAITRVSKTWYSITIDSPLYTQQLMRSTYFHTHALPPFVMTWNVERPANFEVTIWMWGFISVLRRGGKDTVMACRSYRAAPGDLADSWAFHLAFFFTSSEEVPGMLEEDQVLLKGRWLEVLKSYDDRREPWNGEGTGFGERFKAGIWRVVSPLPEELAEGAWPDPSRRVERARGNGTKG